MRTKWILVSLLVLAMLLSLTTANLGLAQGPGGEGAAQPQGHAATSGTVESKISYQGVLWENGQPVNGSRDMIFRLYSDDTCSTQVGGDITMSGVQVTNGRFHVVLDVNQADFNGQALWLEAQVGNTKIGCQEILPAPYALSLRPGATISGTLPFFGSPLLTVQSGKTFGALTVLRIKSLFPPQGYSVGVQGTGDWGVYGYSETSDGYGGYFENTTGTALKAAGSGIIQSTAVSYVFVPAGEVVPHADSFTDLQLRYYGRGTVDIKRPAGSGTEQVIIPISLPAVLYGQPVRIANIRVYYKTTNAASYIDATALYRQKLDMGYYTLINNGTNRTSTTFTSYQLNCTASECRLDADEGFITLALTLHFASNADYIILGGVRVTLEHD